MLPIFILAICLFYTQAQEPPYKHGWNKYTLNGRIASFRTVSLDRGANKLYLGGINAIYEFNPQNVSIDPRQLMWKPRPNSERTCLKFKSDVNSCQNNIRVFLPINSTHMYTCGSMAYLPQCAYVDKETFTMTSTENGRWKTPPDPYASTVSVIANQTLFTATRGSTHGSDAIITRALNGVTLRTKAGDKFWLHDPVFVGSYHVNSLQPLQGKVMLFFREKAEEFLPYNFGMASDPNERNTVSRVATVCVNDHGGSAYVLNRRFATYVKKTMVCNAPIFAEDETIFRYTHLESTFQLVDDNGRTTMYGIFTMPNDAIAGSAICAFTMSDIEKALATNQYWTRSKSPGVISTTYKGDEISAPGNCVKESRFLSQTRLTFSQNHPIKFGYIFPSRNTPFYQEPGTRFSHIVVDTVSSQRSRLNENVTVLYMMTASGLLKRVVFPTNNPTRNWTLPDIKLEELKSNESVVNMVLGDNYLYVVTNSTVVQMPLAACSVYTSCNECVTTEDPYCIPIQNGSCTSTQEMRYDEIEVLKTTEVICPPQPSDVHPEQLLIEQLRQNMSLLIENNSQIEERLAQIGDERDRLSVASTTCNIENGALNSENGVLRNRLSSTERVLSEIRVSYSSSIEKERRCERTKNFFMDHAIRIAQELQSRPTVNEHKKKIQKISQERDGVRITLRQCREENSKVIRKASACSANMKRVSDQIASMNATCYKEKLSQQESFSRELATLREKISTLYQALVEAEVNQNNTICEANKKLQTCSKLSDNLLGDNSLLKKEMKNLTLLAKKLEREKRRIAWVLRKYRNQHVCIGGNKWYVSESTNSLFFLTEERATFDNAQEKCQQMNASLAIFRNNQELGYITNLIRAAQPNRYYWIGLKKNADGLMRWRDGSAFKKFRSRISDLALEPNERSTFCAEVGGTERWELAPCYRLRRFICQKERTPTETIDRK